MRPEGRDSLKRTRARVTASVRLAVVAALVVTAAALALLPNSMPSRAGADLPTGRADVIATDDGPNDIVLLARLNQDLDQFADVRLYVAHSFAGTLKRFDLIGTEIAISVTPIPGLVITNITLSPSGTMYVDAFNLGFPSPPPIVPVDPWTLNVGEAIPVAGGNGNLVRTNQSAAGVLPATNSVYFAHFAADSVIVLNADSNTIIATIPVGDGPTKVEVNRNTGRAYVTNSSDDTVSVIDTVSNTEIAIIEVGAGPTALGVNSRTNRIYIANTFGGTVSVIDGASGTVVSTVPVGDFPRGIGVNQGLNRIYVANSANDNVSVVDGALAESDPASAVIGAVQVGDFPTAVAVSPTDGRVYVTDFMDDTVSVIVDPDATRAALWTDVDCDGDTDAIDSLKVLRHVAGLPVPQSAPCPEVGTLIVVSDDTGTTLRRWGDADCDGVVDAIDSLKKLRSVVGLSVAQEEPCPDIGSAVQIAVT